MGMSASNPEEHTDFEDQSIPHPSQSDLESKKTKKRGVLSSADVQDVNDYEEKSVSEVKALATVESGPRKIDLSGPLFKRVDRPDGKVELVADLSDFTVEAIRRLGLIEHSEELERLYRNDFDEEDLRRKASREQYFADKKAAGLKPDMAEMKALNLVDDGYDSDLFDQDDLQTAKKSVANDVETEANLKNKREDYEEHLKAFRDQLSSMGIARLGITLMLMIAASLFGRVLKMVTGGKLGDFRTELIDDVLLFRSPPMTQEEFKNRFDNPEFEKINTKKEFNAAFLNASKFDPARYERFGVVSPVILDAAIGEQKKALSKTYAQLGEIAQEIPGWEKAIKKHSDGLDKMRGDGEKYSDKEALGRVIMHLDPSFLTNNIKKLEKNIVFKDIEVMQNGGPEDGKPDLKNVIDVVTGNFGVIQANLGFALAKAGRFMYEEMDASERPSDEVLKANTSGWSYKKRLELHKEIGDLVEQMSPKGVDSPLVALEEMNQRIRASYQKEAKASERLAKRQSEKAPEKAQQPVVASEKVASSSNEKSDAVLPSLASAAALGAVSDVSTTRATMRPSVQGESVLSQMARAEAAKNKITPSDRLASLMPVQRSMGSIEKARAFVEMNVLGASDTRALNDAWKNVVEERVASGEGVPDSHIQLLWGEGFLNDVHEKIAVVSRANEKGTSLSPSFIADCNDSIDSFVSQLQYIKEEFQEILTRVSNAGIQEPKDWKSRLIGYARNADAIADLQSAMGYEEILPERKNIFTSDLLEKASVIHSDLNNLPKEQIAEYNRQYGNVDSDAAPKQAHG